MSAHIPCTCPGSRQERTRNWYVSLRCANYSYFESPRGGRHKSDYSTVRCINCLMYKRSKAKFVDDLLDPRPVQELVMRSRALEEL